MINIAISTTLFSPIHFLYALAECQHDKLTAIPNQLIHLTDWGSPLDEDTFIQVPPQKTVIHLLWLSIIDKYIYSFILPLEDLAVNDNDCLLIGCSNYGNVCIWRYSKYSSTIIHSERVKCIDEKLSSRIRNKETIALGDEENVSLENLCEVFKRELSIEINSEEIDNSIVDNYMKQFTYRYQVVFELWDEDEEKWNKYDEEKGEVIPEFEYIEESLFDGTHDKLHDGGLMKYHEAGKPKKLALKWHIKKSDYSAYFWFEDEEICAIFNKFYGQHPDTKTDFIIHIDPIKKKYELSLYRYGLKEPVIIPETAYQLIVFKSGFENYRSDNYNQPTGAWIW